VNRLSAIALMGWDLQTEKEAGRTLIASTCDADAFIARR
jgi:hypothetical protein